MIMEAKLPVRLRVLIGAVENAVAGNAYHPGDVIVQANGEPVRRVLDLRAAASAARESSTPLVLVWYRRGSRMEAALSTLD